MAVPATPGSAGPEAVRFGITVSRRQARRAVVRNAVKRILREAARHAAADLTRQLDATLPARRLDVLLRLKAPLPQAGAAPWGAVKTGVRREADSLMDQLQGQLGGPLFARMAGGAPSRPVPDPARIPDPVPPLRGN